MKTPMRDRPKFIDHSSQPTASPSEGTIVFVHGIYSYGKRCFGSLADELRTHPPFAAWRFYYYDYDYRLPIAKSGLDFADRLAEKFGKHDKKSVTLISHSMGGLVSRLALLQGCDRLKCVGRLVMLGTPNSGAVSSARLALLSNLMRTTADGICSITDFQRGILQLSNVTNIFDPLIRDVGCVAQTSCVEYVTIPGMCFNRDTPLSPRAAGVGFRAANAALGILNLIPGLSTRFSLPHDGIVEEKSVDMLSETSEQFSERKCVGVNQNGQYAYLHIRHTDYREVNHVQIQSAQRTVEILKDLLTRQRASDWRTKLAPGQAYTFNPEVCPD